MTLEKALAYLDFYRDMGSFYELETVRKLLSYLGNPQDQLDIIHVAGTNGKGSTIAYLSAILQQGGYRVGTYTSPSVYNYLERFTYQSLPLDASAFTAITAQVAQAADHLAAEGNRHATVFEMELAIAYLGALHTGSTLLIQETGLGGRLDATNIVTSPRLTVITAISLDHQQELGHTLADISREKAGILKPGAPLVAYCNPPEVNQILRARGEALQIPVHVIDCTSVTIDDGARFPQRFYYQGQTYEIPLLGIHQIYNALLAINAASILSSSGFPLRPEDIKAGLRQARWPGRFDIIHTHPVVVMDGAHNPQAAEALANSVAHLFPGKVYRAVVHVFKDKDAAGILAPFSGQLSQLYLSSTPNPRSLSENELAEIAATSFPPHTIQTYHDLSEAITSALTDSSPDDVILIFGSLSHLAAASATVHSYMGDNNHD